MLELAAEMGYVASSAASGLATGRTKTIGVLAPYVSRWFFSRAIEGVDEELHAHNYSLMLINLGGYGASRSRLFEHTMLRKQIDALVVLCLALQPSELEHLHRVEIPLVSVGPVEGFHGVAIDDYEATKVATNYLIGLGHRRIAQLQGVEADEMNFEVPKLRNRAFEATMLAAGLALRPEWELVGDFTFASGVKAAAWLFDAGVELPTAIFCASDEMALGVLSEARSRGIQVPQQLSILGIDDHEFSAASGLSTIWQDPVGQGRTAAGMLLKQLDGESGVIRTVAAPYKLLRRETTAPPSN